MGFADPCICLLQINWKDPSRVIRSLDDCDFLVLHCLPVLRSCPAPSPRPHLMLAAFRIKNQMPNAVFYFISLQNGEEGAIFLRINHAYSFPTNSFTSHILAMQRKYKESACWADPGVGISGTAFNLTFPVSCELGTILVPFEQWETKASG